MKAKLHHYELSKIFRQANPYDANLLARIRTASQTAADLDYVNKNVVSSPPNGATVISVFNIAVDRVNQDEVSKVNGESLFLTAKRTGTYAAKWPSGSFKKEGPYLEDIFLRRGCKVIIKRNGECNDELGCTIRYVNGDGGTLLGMQSKRSDKLLIQRKDGQIVELPPHKAKDCVYEVEMEVVEEEDELGFKHKVEKPKFVEIVKGTYTQYPVTLGYAMTCHASQGQTLDRVHLILPSEKWMAEKKPQGLIYTAMSRVTDLSRLTFNRPLTNSDIWCRNGLQSAEQQYEMF